MYLRILLYQVSLQCLNSVLGVLCLNALLLDVIKKIIEVGGVHER